MLLTSTLNIFSITDLETKYLQHIKFKNTKTLFIFFFFRLPFLLSERISKLVALSGGNFSKKTGVTATERFPPSKNYFNLANTSYHFILSALMKRKNIQFIFDVTVTNFVISEMPSAHMVPEGVPGQKNTIQVSYLSEIVSTSRFGICKF